MTEKPRIRIHRDIQERKPVTKSAVKKTKKLVKSLHSEKYYKEKVVANSEGVVSLFTAIENHAIDVDALEPYQIYEPIDYKDGPEGFIKWCEENVYIPIYPVGATMAQWCAISALPTEINPKTGKSYRSIWEAQAEICRTALRMVDGEFIHRLIVFCWMRGEGKSLLACLIQLWKFMNWSKQQIVLGANSKDQVTFVHFDIIKDIILNSPKLLAAVGKRNILEKKIRLTDDQGNDVSVIKAISSFSGIVSNITGYTFSEIFDMKNPKFFVQLDGSIRNIPNAFGVIDSTVSAKSHILYQLYDTYIHRKDPSLFFSYRFSPKGQSEDYWNPNMSQPQLDSYRSKFPLAEFERYFLNTWGSASLKVFSDEALEATQWIGCDGVMMNSQVLMQILAEKVKAEQNLKDELFNGKTRDTTDATALKIIRETKQRLIPIEKFIPLRDDLGQPQMATLDDLERLGNLLDTKWAILVGLDRADPMKVSNKGARTILTCVAKGLPGSGSRPFLTEEGNIPNYVYVYLHVANILDHSLESIKTVLQNIMDEFDGIDSICSERWGIWDLVSWFEEKGVKFEAIFPTYDKQKASFSEFYLLATGARLKCSPLGVMGSRSADIFREEAEIFYHDSDKKWFGSAEKMETNGIQDDVMFSSAWCIYGGRALTPNDFKERRNNYYFGTMITNTGFAAKY